MRRRGEPPLRQEWFRHQHVHGGYQLIKRSTRSEMRVDESQVFLRHTLALRNHHDGNIGVFRLDLLCYLAGGSLRQLVIQQYQVKLTPALF